MFIIFVTFVNFHCSDDDRSYGRNINTVLLFQNETSRNHISD